ncbi:MAG: hypothetical protein HXS44_02790 [Theionarchaea archaeon]|nr:hypothetical protein [Theionarchaea archaeon]
MKQVVILLLLCMYVLGSPDWRYYKGSPERTGSIDTPAPDSAYLLWKSAGSNIYFFPLLLEVHRGSQCHSTKMPWIGSPSCFVTVHILLDI